MLKNTENIRIDEVLEELYHLREENQGLKIDNDFLDRQNRALKLRCSKYAIENRELTDEINDLRFTHKYLTSEEAGKAFARELLGKPMTSADIAEDKAIANGEAHYEATWNINCGDDF
jgi:hypothetical protein